MPAKQMLLESGLQSAIKPLEEQTLHMLAEMPLPRSLVQLVPMMRPQANVKMEKP